LIDRRLVGILAIALIISTAFAVLFFGQPTKAKIEVVKNHWETVTLEGWRRLPLAEGPVPYTLGLVARRPLQELSVRFGILRNQTFTANYTGWSDLTLREKAIRVGGLSLLDSRASDVSESMDVEPIEQEGRALLHGEERRVLVLDYYPCMEALADPSSSIKVPYLFAFVFDESGNITQFYSGYWDFFENRDMSIQDLTIQRNENATRYANDQNMGQGSLPIGQTLNMLGKITFTDLKRDDRVFVTFRVNGGAVPGQEAFMQVVRLRIDGEYPEPIINVLRR